MERFEGEAEHRAEFIETPVDVRLTTAVKQKEVFEGLTRHPAWRILEAFIREQVDLRTRNIMLQPVSVDKIDEQNFTRGECSFGEVVLNYVKQQITDADEVIEVYRVERNLESSEDEDEHDPNE